jgi:hypothetical protein
MLYADLIYDISYAIVYNIVTVLEQLTMLIPVIVPSKPGLNMNMNMNINLNSYELVTKDGPGPRPLRWIFQERTGLVALVS